MKNIGLMRCTVSDAAGFTTETGIRLRRAVNPLLRRVLHLAVKRRIVVEQYPALEPGEPYIFASTHFFDEDIIANLAVIDRNAWVLIGTTDQLEHNPQMYAAWLNGLVYVNRLEADSRKESVKKMLRILNAGSSVLIFPEGGWNNSENLLVNPLFSGPWLLAKSTTVPCIPVAVFCEHNSDVIYMRYGEPMDIGCLEKDEALDLLRDQMASMMYEMIIAHASPLSREQLTGDCHLRHMEERRQEYLRVNWTRDTWDEELTVRKPSGVTAEKDVYAFAGHAALTPENARVILPAMELCDMYQRYDFKAYMHKNWRGKTDSAELS